MNLFRKCLATVSALCAVVPTLASSAACPDQKARDLILQNIHDGNMEAIQSFQQAAWCFEWPTYYLVAKQLFVSGQRDEALRWFYAGQLRGRVSASFDTDESAGPALLSSFNEVIGRPLNQYAGSDLAKWIAVLDWTLAWDAQHPLRVSDVDSKISANAFNKKYEEVRAGLTSMRSQLAAEDPAEFKKQRQANGLE